MIYRHPLRLTADPARVVIRPFHLAWQAQSAEPARARRLVEKVLEMDSRTVRSELGLVYRDFEARHWQTREVFMDRFQEVAAEVGLRNGSLNDARKELIGAYFCHEYSYAAAALMNPSVVPHPDQSGLGRGAKRIVMSLRAVGEGHISSVAFREGIVTAKRELELMPEPPFATAAAARPGKAISRGGPVTVRRHAKATLSGTVLFPVTEPQRHGLEDMRLTLFHHSTRKKEWIGTYTAYSGAGISCEMVRTEDFKRFELIPLTGAAALHKGLALFPRKIDGRYAMIGRQDGENCFLHWSDRLDHWDAGELLFRPRFPWELIQIGNCGPPIELDEGWLVLTHGVGAMRKYSIGAVLLDKDDPSRVIGRTHDPILSPLDHEREGYVPNVVYSCGGMRIGDDLFLPYGVADSSIAFAFVPLKGLLAAMQ